MMRPIPLALLVLFTALAAGDAAAQGAAASRRAAAAPMATIVTPAERAAGWRPLLEAQGAPAWRGYRGTGLPDGWRVERGILMKSAPIEDLVSTDTYGDFELAFDWRLSRGGNAGVFYRATEAAAKIYETGAEYQLLDDAHHPDGKDRARSAAAAYGLYAPPAGVVRPAGAWNASRIVVQGQHVEHWLNGRKVVDYTLGSPDWEARVKASKFAEWPGYGRAARGHLGIQGDHDGELAIRRLRVRVPQ